LLRIFDRVFLYCIENMHTMSPRSLVNILVAFQGVTRDQKMLSNYSKLYKEAQIPLALAMKKSSILSSNLDNNDYDSRRSELLTELDIIGIITSYSKT
jgi:hypothetical protein